eukprot:3828748-Rhodomonas_salina.2
MPTKTILVVQVGPCSAAACCSAPVFFAPMLFGIRVRSLPPPPVLRQFQAGARRRPLLRLRPARGGPCQASSPAQ